MNEKPRSKLKLYFYLFVVTVLLATGFYGYYKYTEFAKLQNSANNVISENKALINKVNEYNQLKTKLENEKTRCEQLLLKEEGNFAEFTYCQKFIDFLGNNPTN